MRRFVLLPLIMFFFACDGPSDARLTPTGPSFSAGLGPVVESASGSGMRFRLPEDPDNVAWRTFAFAAKKHLDGSVQGQVELVIHRNALPPDRVPAISASRKASGKITCLTVDGNEAWMGGHFTSGYWIPPRTDDAGIVFYVEDNGQGVDAEPDQLSLLYYDVAASDVESFCNDMPAYDDELPYWPGGPPVYLWTFEIEAGNIQVKG